MSRAIIGSFTVLLLVAGLGACKRTEPAAAPAPAPAPAEAQSQAVTGTPTFKREVKQLANPTRLRKLDVKSLTQATDGGTTTR